MPRPPARRRPIWFASLAVGMALVAGMMAAPRRAGAQQTTPCDLGSPSSFSHVSAKPKYQPMPQQLVEISSNVDGATIQIGLVRPKVPAGVRVPVIVDASPYYHAMNILTFEKCRPFLFDNLRFTP